MLSLPAMSNLKRFTVDEELMQPIRADEDVNRAACVHFYPIMAESL